MLRLLASHGHEEQVFAVPEGEARLGSATENDIVVRAPGISRRHALVCRCPGGVEIRDLNSKNGLIVQGQRVKHAILSPGLRLQIGAAWLEIEEVSTTGEALSLFLQGTSETRIYPSPKTTTLEPQGTVGTSSPADTPLALAYHITQAGAGLPGERADLLVRIRATLGAEAFGFFERTRQGQPRIVESVGEFFAEEVALFASIADKRSSIGREIVLKRTGCLLLAGRDAWFIGASFTEESLAREGWRKDFVRFLADQFVLPVRNLDELNSEEAARVLALARGNKKRAATLLGISRGTLYKLFARHNPRRD